jgi:hypothetical protein
MKILSTGRRGRQPTFQAKIGTMPSAIIIVKRVRDFEVGQRIEYADTYELRGMSVGMAPRWHRGTVWKIECDRLYIDRI